MTTTEWPDLATALNGLWRMLHADRDPDIDLLDPLEDTTAKRAKVAYSSLLIWGEGHCSTMPRLNDRQFMWLESCMYGVSSVREFGAVVGLSSPSSAQHGLTTLRAKRLVGRSHQPTVLAHVLFAREVGRIAGLVRHVVDQSEPGMD